MPLLGDRVQEITTTTGTGTVSLAGAVTGYRTFNAVFTNSDVVFYTIDDTLGNWEVGYGTVGTGTLTRDTVITSSNADALVDFGAGSKRVFCTAPTQVLLPDQTSNNGKILSTDGTTPSWIANTVGTVTSVSGTGTVSGISLSGTVTSSGSLTLGGALDLSAYNGAGAFTTLSASSTVSGSGFSTYLASPPAIGGSSPAAGNFTTLGATGAVTLSGGTANGVAYLNGSKVLTTGTALTFDGSNLGLGVTPSAWGGIFNVIQGPFGGCVAFQNSGASTKIGSNWYYNGASYIYTTTGGASRYDLGGVHSWYTAASGNAGDPISFTRAMTLDASGSLGIGYTSLTGLGSNGLAVAGNVGIGTNSPAVKLHVSGADAITICRISGASYAFRTASISGVGMRVEATTANESAYAPLILAGSTATLDGSPVLFNIGGVEKARITSAGNLLVNDTVERGGKVVVTNTPTSQWGIDQSGSQLTIANGANAVLATGSGLIVLNSRTTGEAGVYLVCGSSVVLLGGTSGYVVGTTPASGKTSIGWDGSNYRIYNNQGASQTFGIAMIRSRDAN